MTLPLPRTLEILDRLVAFPTVSDVSNLALIDHVEALLRDAGFRVWRLVSPCGQKAGLFARTGPDGTDGAGGVCLSAHTDVVPVAGQDWSLPAFALTRRDGRLHGRGVTDMKGFLAAALAMAERAGQAELAEPLSLVISYDEEVGCVGIRQMLPGLRPLIGSPRAVIVGEPTSMQVAIGHKGKAALRATCHGEAGHSALAPDFINAIHVAAEFVNALRAVQDKLTEGASDPAYAVPCSTVHVGTINGGRALNIVPDRTEMTLEYRHLAETPGAGIRAAIDTAAQEAARRFGPAAAITLQEINAYPGLDTAPDSAVATWAAGLAGTAMTKVAFGTEAGYFAGLGLPAVVIGPGDMARDGHKPDEGLDLAELARCDRFLDRVLTGLVGQDMPGTGSPHA